MTKKARNWFITLSILAFPFVLFLGCLVFMKDSTSSNPDGPQKAVPQATAVGTNSVYPPR